MQTVRHYWIECQTYHNEIVARIQYRDENNQLQESALYSLPEIGNILELWKQNELLGPFGIGSVLSDSAVFTITQKGVK
jgi:hypothetical protein